MRVYSQPEFEMTMEGCKRQWKISDEMVRQAEKSWVNFDGVKYTIKFNTKKIISTDRFAEISFYPQEGAANTIVTKDLHYGLFILGTEKHESRRIDNQLRGRAGRQGDPGVSVFFVALDDLIMRKM